MLSLSLFWSLPFPLYIARIRSLLICSTFMNAWFPSFGLLDMFVVYPSWIVVTVVWRIEYSLQSKNIATSSQLELQLNLRLGSIKPLTTVKRCTVVLARRSLLELLLQLESIAFLSSSLE